MKYGLLVYKETDNIGDDIQAYAAECFLPHVDYFVDRENLNTFYPDQEEQVAVIMNAWFMYHKYNWPPSPYIIPYFISCHFTNTDFYRIEKDFFDEVSVKYFQKYAPVGCRDQSTKSLLDQSGIPTYISGCVTLTIQKKQGVQKENKICLVDVDAEIQNKIENMDPQADIQVITHNIAKQKEFDWTTRKQRVESLLEIYQAAKLVITTRLHCALPCLALGTPVLLVYIDEAYFRDRMGFYLPMVHHCTKEQFMNGQVLDLEHLSDSDGRYMDLRKNIIEKIKQFINDLENRQNNFKIVNNYWYLQLKRQSEMLQKQLPKLRKQHDLLWELSRHKEWQEREIDWLKKKADGTVKWYEERETWYKSQEDAYKSSLEEREKWYKKREEDLIQSYKKQIKQYETQQKINEQEIEEKRSMLALCQVQFQELKIQHDIVMGSYAWKIGNVMLWLPRKLRKLLTCCK